MAYIYLDESGDTSFNLTQRGVSKHFILTFLLVDNPRALEKIVKKIMRGLSKGEKKYFSMLHAYKESPLTRERLLKEVSLQDLSVFSISIDKTKAANDIRRARKQIHKLAAIALMERIISKQLLPTDRTIQLIASSWGSGRAIREEFQNQLQQRMIKQHQLDIRVSIKPAHSEKCLQVADMISWAIFRQLEHGAGEYYSLIKEKVLYQAQLP